MPEIPASVRGIVSRARRAVRLGSGREGDTMNALHRLKAYFGMVPAEEFDAAAFGAAGYDEYQPGYPNSSHGDQSHRPDYDHHQTAARRPHRAGFEAGFDYADSFPGDSFSTPAGHHVAARVHPARSPSCSTDSRVHTSRTPEFRTNESWEADAAAVRGSLAIDTAAAEAVGIGRRIDSKTMVHQPIAPRPIPQSPRSDPLTSDELHPLARIVTLHPHSYNEARPIGERYREGNPVIMNLTAMEDRDAKRLVDFAAGLAFALRGSIDKVTNKVFLLSPPDVEVSAEDRRRIAEGRLFH